MRQRKAGLNALRRSFGRALARTKPRPQDQKTRHTKPPKRGLEPTLPDRETQQCGGPKHQKSTKNRARPISQAKTLHRVGQKLWQGPAQGRGTTPNARPKLWLGWTRIREQAWAADAWSRLWHSSARLWPMLRKCLARPSCGKCLAMARQAPAWHGSADIV